MEKEKDIFDKIYNEVISDFDKSRFKLEIIDYFKKIKSDFYDTDIADFLSYGERKTNILRLRLGVYNDGMKQTYKDISVQFGVTKTRIGQVLKEILDVFKEKVLSELHLYEYKLYLGIPIKIFNNNIYTDDKSILELPLSNYVSLDYEKIDINKRKDINVILIRIYRNLKYNYDSLNFTEYDCNILLRVIKSKLSSRRVDELYITNTTFCKLMALNITNIGILIDLSINNLYALGLLNNSDISSLANTFGDVINYKKTIEYIDKNRKLDIIRNLRIEYISLSYRTLQQLKDSSIETLDSIIGKTDIELKNRYGLRDYTIKEIRSAITNLIGENDELDCGYNEILIEDLKIPNTIYDKLKELGYYTIRDLLDAKDYELKSLGIETYRYVTSLICELRGKIIETEAYDKLTEVERKLLLESLYAKRETVNKHINSLLYEKSGIDSRIKILTEMGKKKR